MKKALTIILALLLALALTCAVAMAEETNGGTGSVVTDHGAIEYTEYYKNGKLLSDKEANCKNNPVIGRVFYEDGWYEDMVVEFEHDWGEWVSTATCTEAGVETRTCKICGATETVEVPALGHLWSSEVDAPDQWGTIIENATCEKEGLAQDYCKRCGVMGEKTRVIEKPEHIFDKPVLDLQPMCDEETQEVQNGVYHFVCKYCDTPELDENGDILYRDLTLDDYKKIFNVTNYDGHVWDAWVTEIPATCAKEGKDVRWCKRCGKEEYRTTAALNHNNYKALQLVEEHLVDCFHRYNVYYCPLCKGTIYGYWDNGTFKEIAKADVDAGNVDAMQPTESHFYLYTDEYLVEEVEPTCETNGKKVYKCVYHDEVDGHNTNEGDDYKVIVVPKLGHDWIGWVCEHEIGENGNEYNHYVNTCRRCGLTKDFNGTYSPEPCEDDKHEYVVMDSTAATCTAEGVTISVCRLCGDEKIETAKATGHDWGEKEVVVEATCKGEGKDGKYLYTCKNCGALRTETVAAPSHVIVEDPAVEPAIGVPGKTAGSHCEVCGDIIVAQEEIPAIVANTYELDTSAVTKGSTTSGLGYVKVEGTEEVKNLYVRITWNFTLASGDTFSYCTVKEVKVGEDGEYSFKASGASAIAGATLNSVYVVVTTDEDADVKPSGFDVLAVNIL